MNADQLPELSIGVHLRLSAADLLFGLKRALDGPISTLVPDIMSRFGGYYDASLCDDGGRTWNRPVGGAARCLQSRARRR
jgi:hypothetical protein